jgi:hypothetical protein
MNTLTDALADRIAADGFAFVHGPEMRALFAREGSLADWPGFAASWDDLGLDTYMADGGRYRKRRRGTFSAVAGGEPIQRAAHQPHYQSRDYNPLNGGIARWFDPVLPEIGAGPSMTTILDTCRTLFEHLSPAPDAIRGPARAWHIEVHQFRIEVRSGVEGRPTPEGMHRDGVDQVLVLLIGRRNIPSGVTTIHDTGGRNLGSFTLAEPFDAAWVDDHRVMHGVTPVEPIEPAQPGFRDVLVVTFSRQDGAPG